MKIMGKEKKAKKEEKPEAKEKRENLFSKGIPLYLVALLVVFALLIGFTYFNTLSKPENVVISEDIVKVPVIQIEDSNFNVEVINVLSNEHTALKGSSNSLLFRLNEIGVSYSDRNVSAESEEGQKIVQDYGIKIIPTSLVKTSDLEKYSKVNELYLNFVSSMKAFFKQRNGYLIVPESNLDLKEHLKIFLMNPEISTCRLPEEGHLVYLFKDPYQKDSIGNTANQQLIKKGFEDAGINAEFKWKYAPTLSSIELFDKFTQEEVEKAAKYYAFASTSNKGLEFDLCLSAKRCGLKEEEVTVSKMSECTRNNDKIDSELIDESFLEQCFTQTGLNKTEFEEFSKNLAQTYLLEDYRQAVNFGLINLNENVVAPFAVVDCRFTDRLHNVDLIVNRLEKLK